MLQWNEPCFTLHPADERRSYSFIILLLYFISDTHELMVVFGGTYLFWFHYLSSSIRLVNDPGKRDSDTAVCQPISNKFDTKLWFWFDSLSLQFKNKGKKMCFSNILLNLQIISGLLWYPFRADPKIIDVFKASLIKETDTKLNRACSDQRSRYTICSVIINNRPFPWTWPTCFS